MRLARLGLSASITVLCLAAGACGADGGGGGAAGGDGTLRVAANTNATMLPFWAAQEQGFFDDHGIDDVKLTNIENVATLPPALGKSFDIVLSTPTLVISSNEQGIPVSWVSGSSVDSVQHKSGALMVMPDSGIDDVSDLSGKTIGVLNESGTLHIATAYWLKQEGVDLDSVDIVQVDGPSQADQLASGRIDAVESVTPFTGQIAAAGATSLGVPYRSLGDVIAPIMFAAQTQWAEDNADEVDDFRAALEDGAEWIADNDDDARALLQEKTGYPEDVVKTIEFPQFDTTVRTEDLDTWYKAMHATTGFSTDADVDSFAFEPQK
jgi:ABC-type nitrate/sulfonate/bicarbonate transport system substrate-binding protein